MTFTFRGSSYLSEPYGQEYDTFLKVPPIGGHTLVLCFNLVTVRVKISCYELAEHLLPCIFADIIEVTHKKVIRQVLGSKWNTGFSKLVIPVTHGMETFPGSFSFGGSLF